MSGCHPVSEFVSMAQSADDDMSEMLMLEHKEVLDIEMTYQRGESAQALEASERMLSQTIDTVDRLMLLSTHMMASIASADDQGAHGDMLQLLALCNQILESDAHESLRGFALFYLARVESVLAIDLVDHELLETNIRHMHHVLRRGMGPMLALYYIRHGRFQVATGIAYACNTIVDPYDEVAHIDLLILMASTHQIEGRIEDATDELEKAWNVSLKTGIVMPFVQLQYLLLGLQRCAGFALDAKSEMYRLIESLSPKYRKGWFGLRERCGLSQIGFDLTPLEWDVSGLAAMGWSNKEIATHFGIAVNTVKHQLTSSYQKLSISKRSEIASLICDEMTRSSRTKFRNQMKRNIEHSLSRAGTYRL